MPDASARSVAFSAPAVLPAPAATAADGPVAAAGSAVRPGGDAFAVGVDGRVYVGTVQRNKAKRTIDVTEIGRAHV